MAENKRPLSISLDESLLIKFRYVSKQAKRSMAQQIAFICEERIAEFEKAVEKIELDKKD